MPSTSELQTDLTKLKAARTRVIDALSRGETAIEIELRGRRVRSPNLKELIGTIDALIESAERQIERKTRGSHVRARVMHRR